MAWEETGDLGDAVFFVDLDCRYLVASYYHSSELAGGYIHIRGQGGKVIYSYHVKDKTISPSSLPCLVETSNVSMWQVPKFRLEGDRGEGRSCRSKTEDGMLVRAVESNNAANESHLLGIPFHVLETIMELCVGVEYMNLRATCRRCHLAAPPVRWRDKASLHNHSLVSAPWLMVYDHARGTITFTDPMLGDTYFMKTLPVSVWNNVIYCSRHGWLLFSVEFARMVLFNPFTNDVRELPLAPFYFATACFSAPPTSPDCIVVGVMKVCACVLSVCRGDTHWRVVALNGIPTVYFTCFFRFPTFHGGQFCALSFDATVDVFGQDFTWKSYVDEAHHSTTHDAQYFLAASDDGHLLMVVMGEMGESVEVFQLNDSTQEWEKMDGLGRRTVYVCDNTCLCIEAKTREMENKICFPRLHSDGKIVVYSLDTCRYHTLGGQRDFEDLTGTKLYHHPHAWIEPTWS